MGNAKLEGLPADLRLRLGAGECSDALLKGTLLHGKGDIRFLDSLFSDAKAGLV
jgi:hypothetical protein